jgi:RNA recognition motif-containing protein
MAALLIGVCLTVTGHSLSLWLTLVVVPGYHSIRDNLPQELPTKPPYTAHLGNLSYDATAETVTEFFEDCNIVNVRIIEDREQNRPKGFAYAEFGDLEGLKTALTRDGQSFQGRTIRVKVADPRESRHCLQMCDLGS